MVIRRRLDAEELLPIDSIRMYNEKVACTRQSNVEILCVDSVRVGEREEGMLMGFINGNCVRVVGTTWRPSGEGHVEMTEKK